jgi:hypothetical protein
MRGVTVHGTPPQTPWRCLRAPPRPPPRAPPGPAPAASKAPRPWPDGGAANGADALGARSARAARRRWLARGGPVLSGRGSHCIITGSGQDRALTRARAACARAARTCMHSRFERARVLACTRACVRCLRAPACMHPFHASARIARRARPESVPDGRACRPADGPAGRPAGTRERARDWPACGHRVLALHARGAVTGRVIPGTHRAGCAAASRAPRDLPALRGADD